MGDLRTFAKSMRLTAQAVDKNATEAVKSVSKAVGLAVIYATPVDTSRARMNWQTSIDAPITTVLSPYPNVPPTPDYGRQTAIDNLNDVVIKYAGSQNGIYITNNLDYIQELNNGSSSQAPANFVELAVLAGLNSVKSIKLLP